MRGELLLVARLGLFRERRAPGRPPAALRPSGATAASAAASRPCSPPHRLSVATISARRANCKSWRSSAASRALKPGKITGKGASCHT